MPFANRGVIVGSDAAMEWLLSWWWSRFSKYNAFPVVFADFGMSCEKRAWCEKKGMVIPISQEPLSGQVPLKRQRQWEKHYTPQVWNSRRAWFQKPLAFLASPFEISLWIDLDCEISGPLDPIFSAFDSDAELALTRDPRKSRWLSYSSGVVAFRKEAPVIAKWADLCLKAHSRYMGDENVLAHLIRKGEGKVQEFPHEFNWMMYNGYNPGALIHHWGGTWGKEYIRKFGGIHGL